MTCSGVRAYSTCDGMHARTCYDVPALMRDGVPASTTCHSVCASLCDGVRVFVDVR